MQGFKQNAKHNSSMNCYKTGGSVKSKPMKKAAGGKADAKQDKAIVKKAFKQHDKNMHGGKTETLKLKDGGKAKKADGGSMMSKKAKLPMPKGKPKKSMAVPKSKASKSADVAPLGSPAAMEPAMGMTPQPMMSHGGTVRHEHYAMGGQVGASMGGAMGAGMAAGAMGGGMGAMADPRLLAAKKRLAGIGAGAGAGLGAAPAGAAPQGMATPMPAGMPS